MEQGKGVFGSKILYYGISTASGWPSINCNHIHIVATFSFALTFNPFLSKTSPLDEKNRLALARVKYQSQVLTGNGSSPSKATDCCGSKARNKILLIREITPLSIPSCFIYQISSLLDVVRRSMFLALMWQQLCLKNKVVKCW